MKNLVISLGTALVLSLGVGILFSLPGWGFLVFFLIAILPLGLYAALNRRSEKSDVIEKNMRSLNSGEKTIQDVLDSMTQINKGASDSAFHQYLHQLGDIYKEINQLSVNNKNLGKSLVSRSDGSLKMMQEISRLVTAVEGNIFDLTKSIMASKDAIRGILDSLKILTHQVDNQMEAVQISSSAVEQMNASIQSVARITQSRSKEMTQLMEKSQEGNQIVVKTVREIKEVAQQTGSIMSLINLINDVASRTNLLAINASIEAAHAGEKGKGFAVVANEIRKLAESTADNAKHITESLTEITSRIQQAQSFSEEGGRIFSEVNNGVDETNRSFKEIASSMDELELGQGEILKSVTTLSETTHRVQEGSENIHNKTESIHLSMGHVDKSSEKTEMAMREISTWVEQLNKGSMQTMTLVHQNLINMESLTKSIALLDTGAGDDDFEAPLIGIKWSKGFSVGVQAMDQQHQKLIKMLNDYLLAMVSGEGTREVEALLTQLGEYVALHFKEEEELMESLNFPQREEHKEIHRKFIAKLEELTGEFQEQGPTPLLATRVQDEVANWLIQHIAGSDKQYGVLYKTIYG